MNSESDGKELLEALLKQCWEAQQSITRVVVSSSIKEDEMQSLEQNIGSLLCCIELLVDLKIVNSINVTKAKYDKMLSLNHSYLK